MPCINKTNAEKRWSVAKREARVCDQIGSFGLRCPIDRIATMSISMYNSSVVVFTQFLGNLSHLLDRAADHAETRKLDPSILLNSRLSPNMYSLTRQVGEAIRHVVLSCSLLTGVEPPVFPFTDPDILELKARIATAGQFIRSLPPALLNGAASNTVVFPFTNGPTRR